MGRQADDPAGSAGADDDVVVASGGRPGEEPNLKRV
jgi:hypothetical protein